MANIKKPVDDWEDVDDWQEVPVNEADDWQEVPVDASPKTYALPETDAASAALTSLSQGFSGGTLDEISGLLEGLGSVFNVRGVGGPIKDISFGDDRSFDQATREGIDRKNRLLRAGREQHPSVALPYELAGGALLGYAAPIGAASSLGKIAQGVGLGAGVGFNYGEGDLQNRLGSAIQGGAFGGALPTASALLSAGRNAVPVVGSGLSGVPKKWLGRYRERGPQMDRSDSVLKIGAELPEDLKALGNMATNKSMESRQILRDEGIEIPREEFIGKLETILGKSRKTNSSSNPVVAKLQQYLKELEDIPGSQETVVRQGARQGARQVVPTQSEVVVTNPTPETVVRQGARQEVRQIPTQSEVVLTHPTVKGPETVVRHGVRQEVRQIPTQSEVVVTNPTPETVVRQGARQEVRQIPTQSEVVLTNPTVKGPERVSGNYTKDAVTDFDELAGWLKSQEKGATGNALAREARMVLQQSLKDRSANYSDKMSEVDSLMSLLSDTNKSFGKEQSAINSLRRIGFEDDGAEVITKNLSRLEEATGKNYRRRLDDALTLQSMGPRKENLRVKSERAPQNQSGVTDTLIGGVREALGRPVVKTTIDIANKIDSLLPKLPPRLRKILLEAKRAGGNSLATTHAMLMETDKQYKELMEQ